jgi:hypothetical protein
MINLGRDALDTILLQHPIALARWIIPTLTTQRSLNHSLGAQN